MRVFVIGALLINTTVARAQHSSSGQGDETTGTGYQTPQPVPGATVATAERKPEQPPSITAERYDEDYSYLRDPHNRTGAWWEALKYVPLTDSGTSYLTLGDELRLREERYWNNAFGSPPLPDDGPYLRYRQFPYADLHLGEQFRMFAQMMVAYGTRSEITKSPFTDQTGFEIGQAIVEWRQSLGDAGELFLRGGRQVFVYGSGRLINAGPNIRTRFDGGVVQWDVADAPHAFLLPEQHVPQAGLRAVASHQPLEHLVATRRAR
jgi:hypothetical protein